MMELAHYEAAVNGDVNEFPFCDIYKRDLSDIFNRVSVSGNSLLHVAASSGNEGITELMACHYPLLIPKSNLEEDTSLHVAVRAGKLRTAKILVDRAKQIATKSEANEACLLKMKNRKGNTALHEALLALQAWDEASEESLDSLVSLAHYLVSSDPLVSYYKNNAGKSPLCLAVESGNMDVLKYLLSSLPKGDDSNNFNSLEGQSPVRIAVEQRKLEALELIKKQKPELLMIRDENGNTPLHYAASEGYHDGVQCLSKINISDGVLAKNKKGHCPIHLACKSGHSKVMKELLKMWPHPEDLLTNKCRNILHIAAKNGKLYTVMCIIEETNNIDKLLNKMDNDGNTPLHLAALGGHPSVAFALVKCSKSKLDLVNNQGLTAYDIAVEQYGNEDMMEASGKQHLLDQPVDEKIADDESLKASGLKRSKKPEQKKALETSVVIYMESKNHNKRFNRPIKAPLLRRTVDPEENQKSINNLLVVATLIIGASFAAGISMASSTSSSDYQKSDGGPTLRFYGNENRTSNSFMIFNTLAMNMSVLAALMLCYAQLVDPVRASRVVWTIYGIVGFAIYMLCLAFWCTPTDIIPSNVLAMIWAIFIYLESFLMIPIVLLLPFLYSDFLYLRLIHYYISLEHRMMKNVIA